jgi:hypothetical protein
MFDEDRRSNKTMWKTLTAIVGSVITTVVLMYNFSTIVQDLRGTDTRIETKLATLESTSLTPRDLITWEHRLTTVEEAVKNLKEDSHPHPKK